MVSKKLPVGIKFITLVVGIPRWEIHCIPKLLLRSVSFSTVLIQGRKYKNMNVLVLYVNPNDIENNYISIPYRYQHKYENPQYIYANGVEQEKTTPVQHWLLHSLGKYVYRTTWNALNWRKWQVTNRENRSLRTDEPVEFEEETSCIAWLISWAGFTCPLTSDSLIICNNDVPASGVFTPEPIVGDVNTARQLSWVSDVQDFRKL